MCSLISSWLANAVGSVKSRHRPIWAMRKTARYREFLKRHFSLSRLWNDRLSTTKSVPQLFAACQCSLIVSLVLCTQIIDMCCKKSGDTALGTSCNKINTTVILRHRKPVFATCVALMRDKLEHICSTRNTKHLDFAWQTRLFRWGTAITWARQFRWAASQDIFENIPHFDQKMSYYFDYLCFRHQNVCLWKRSSARKGCRNIGSSPVVNSSIALRNVAQKRKN